MSTELEARLDRLEESFEFQDNTIEALNQVIIDQQKQLDELLYTVDKLKQALSAAGTESGEQSPDPLPPHY